VASPVADLTPSSREVFVQRTLIARVLTLTGVRLVLRECASARPTLRREKVGT
jgi:hypothetical protein